MEKAFWRFDEDGPLFGAPSQERFSFLADLSSCPFAGAGVRRSCCKKHLLTMTSSSYVPEYSNTQ